MGRIIDALPGVAMPVEAVTETLRHMWDSDSPAPAGRMDFRASQMNLILHFGLRTSEEEAVERFNTAIRFAQKYPCRIVVLCPTGASPGDVKFEGKLFSQCYLGGHLRDVCCCEALILGYSPEQSDFLESQVSTWLESDLPVCHWFHRVPVDRIGQHYLAFLKRCRRVLYDGALEGDGYDGVAWPDPARVADLALARTLPLRQHLGQFISGFAPAELVDGLVSLQFNYCTCISREAWQVMRWQRRAVERCFGDADAAARVAWSFEPMPEDSPRCCLEVEWRYTDAARGLRFAYDRSRKSGLISARLPSGRFEHPLHIEPLAEEAVLAEALFFG